MAIYEGVGIKAPAPVTLNLERHELFNCKMEAERRNAYRRYGGRSDQWGRGFVNGRAIDGLGTISKAAAPILVGIVGEYAFKTFVRFRTGYPIEMDFSLKPVGDGGNDFVIAGVSYQIKCRQSHRNDTLIRRVNDYGEIIDLKSERYVFSEWEFGSPSASLIGWCNRDVLMDQKFQKSPVGKHFNISAPDLVLEPMGRLASEIKADMLLESTEWL